MQPADIPAQPATIPAGWVEAGYGVPDVCARHGEPAAERPGLGIISRPPQWSYILILLGFLIFLIVVLAMRRKVTAPAWPFCAQCVQRRKRFLLVGWPLFLIGVAALIGSLFLSGSGGTAADA